MRIIRVARIMALAGAFCAGAAARAEQAARDQQLLNEGKIQIFNRNWGVARDVFQRVIREYPQGAAAPQAAFFIARSFQFEGRDPDALNSYEDFLRTYPKEPVLPGEARKAVVEIAAKLMEKGDASYRDRLAAALGNPDKDARYFAAIRVSRLKDAALTSQAIPILREIVEKGGDRELVDWARLALLRTEPKAMPKPAAPPAKVEKADPPKKGEPAGQRLFHLVVYKKGIAAPVVELNLPVSLAQLAVAALDESAKQELRKKGVDIDNVWRSLQKLGPMDILTLRDGDNTIKLWIQ